METTPKQFNEAVDELSAQGMEGLIIDLRDNPGGLVDAAAEILDRILPEDQLLVYTVDKNNTREEYHSKDSETIDLPIVVLMNDSSASASEIVSGCLQDLDKATLVGEKSFGKGIVQYVIELDDGSAMQVTAAKYYTPEGRNIHGTGLDPDVEVELDDEKEGDEQLDKAIEILQEEMQGQKAAFAG
jgi:carboxyl-terminal processing protease